MASQKNANKGLKLRHLAGLICKALDLTLTLKTINSGFRKTGITVVNPNFFNETDDVETVGQTPEPLTPGRSTSGSSATSVSNLSRLHNVVHYAMSRQKYIESQPQSMESSMLISPDDLFGLKMKEAERSAKQADNVAKCANPPSVKP